MRTHFSFQAKVLFAFFSAAAAMAAMLGTTWKLAEDSAAASRSVSHTFEVLHSLAEVKANTLQIEFATQSYRISGDRAQITERDATMVAREATLERIKLLTADSPAQQDRWQRLRQVLNERIALSRQIETLRATAGLDAASAFVAGAPLRETRQRTYRIMSDMEAAERTLLGMRSAEQRSARRNAVGAGVAVTLSLIAFLAASYTYIRRQLHQTEAGQKALAENEGRLSTTLHSIGEGVLATDADGHITRMNRVAEQLTGWRAADAVGRSATELLRIVDETSRLPAEVPVARVLATGQSVGLGDGLTLLSRDGTERPVAYNAAPIRDDMARVHGVVVVFRDVAMQRKAERTVREMNAILEQRVAQRTAQLLDSEEHLRSVIAHVPALIAYVDALQCYVYVNDQYRHRFAPGQASITGRTVREVLGEARYATASPLIDGVLSGQPQNYDWQPYPGVWQTISYVPKRDASGRIGGYYVLGTDITERKRAEEEIQALNAALAHRVSDLQRIDRALRTLSAGNRSMLRATDENGLLDSMCSAIAHAGGYPIAMVWYAQQDERKSLKAVAQSGYLPGLDFLQQLQPSWEDNAHGQGAVATAVRTGTFAVVGDMQTHPDYAPWRPYLMGNTSCLACPLVVDGQVIGALALFSPEPDEFGPEEIPLLCESADDLAFGIATLRTAAAQAKAHAAVHKLTHFDPLTGLPNATEFAERLTDCMRAAEDRGESLVVLQTNIERLHEINDALGFAHGDQVLTEFGKRLRAAAPAQAVVARLRGDEFAVLLPHADAAAGTALAEDLATAMLPPFPVADIRIDISVKMGIAVCPLHARGHHELFRRLAIATNDAKRRGVHHALFDPAQDREKPQRLNLAGDLRRAIECEELLVFLQPKVLMATGQVCGSEALVRWMHPRHGMVHPGEFISLAEHTGLIKPLTEWMLERVARLILAWKGQAYALPIAVNLSVRDLHDEGLTRKIQSLGPLSGLLELEITESTVMENTERALDVLRALRDEGIDLYLDDFGTGYSSLSYLQKLPVEYIKIDQSFVRSMGTDRDSAMIVKSTIDLVHDLGRKAVAEGVETRENWEQLVAFGCDAAQGYFIAKPMPAAEFPQWLDRYRATPRPGPTGPG